MEIGIINQSAALNRRANEMPNLTNVTEIFFSIEFTKLDIISVSFAQKSLELTLKGVVIIYLHPGNTCFRFHGARTI